MKSTTTDAARGMTLAELMIACFLLLLLMGACYYLFARALRTFRFGDERTSTLARARTTLYQISREVRDADELYQPKSADITGASPQNPVRASSITIRVSVDVYSFLYNQELATIEKIYYEPGYDPHDSSTWIVAGKRVIARDMSYLQFAWEKPPDPWTTPIPQFVKISVRTGDDPDSPGSSIGLSTKVLMRK